MNERIITTAIMAHFLKAYVAFAKQKVLTDVHSFVQRHVCTAQCDTVSHGNFVFCKRTGFYHCCSEETCPFLVITSGRESRVCRLTGFVYSVEFDNHDLLATTSWIRVPNKHRDTIPPALPDQAMQSSENYECRENDEPQEVYSAPPQDLKRTRANDRNSQTNVDSVSCSRHLPFLDILLRFTGCNISDSLRMFVHEACLSLERILCVSAAYRKMYDDKYHTLFVVYKMVTGMKVGRTIILGVSEEMRKVLPVEKQLPCISNLGAHCILLTKYRTKILRILATLQEDSIRLGLMENANPPA